MKKAILHYEKTEYGSYEGSCPHCGYEFYFDYDEGDSIFDSMTYCYHCGRKFDDVRQDYDKDELARQAGDRLCDEMRGK